GMLFFAADDGTTGRELWQSDCTAPGTVLVRDISAGSGDSNPRGLVNLNGTLVFAADDGLRGRELWVGPTPSASQPAAALGAADSSESRIPSSGAHNGRSQVVSASAGGSTMPPSKTSS